MRASEARRSDKMHVTLTLYDFILLIYFEFFTLIDPVSLCKLGYGSDPFKLKVEPAAML